MTTQIAVSGLRATNQELAVISNNIANSSTNGYRAARAEYSSVYNGSEVGGVTMSGSSQSFVKAGNLNYTGRTMDLGIEGNGFFMVKGQDGSSLYTRAGMFNQNVNGEITDPYGNVLQGYSAGADGKLSTGQIGSIQIQTGSAPAKATSKIELVTNMDMRSAVPVDSNGKKIPFKPDDVSSYNSSNTTSVYDSLGNEHSLTQYYVKTADNKWDVHYVVDSKEIAGKTTALTFGGDGQLKTMSGAGIVANNTGHLVIPATDLKGANELKLALDWKGSTQFGSDYNTTGNQQDGYPSGEINGIRIADDGSIYGTYTNGSEKLQGQVVLASFTNPSGLEQANNTTWAANQNSGQPSLGSPGTGTLGSVSAGYVEGSNVDVTTELVGLMSAQSNYQANAKVLTAADTMLQSLMNAI